MLPSFFAYIFVHLKQKVRLGPELSPKFLSSLGPHPTQKARPDLQLCCVAKAQRRVHKPRQLVTHFGVLHEDQDLN